MADCNYSIAGGWLGTFRYLGIVPVRFEASFNMIPGGFNGEIVDEVFPRLATVAGTQHGLEVRFTKVYLTIKAPDRTKGVDYHGRFSEDGKTIRGKWRGLMPQKSLRWINVSGSWEAHRTWIADSNINTESASSSNSSAVDARS